MRKSMIWKSCIPVIFSIFFFPLIAYADETSFHLPAVVTDKRVWIYTEPSGESDPLGRVGKGEQVKIYEVRSGWLLVQLPDGRRGWTESDNVETMVSEGDISVTAEPGAKGPEAQKILKPYQIKVGDRIQVLSFKTPEINMEVMVRPDGYISLMLLDDVFVVGMTPSELDRHLTNKFKKHLQDPDLTVSLNSISEILDSKVFIGGEVANPREVPLRVPTTVLQAIISSGGFLDTAKKTNVILIHKGERGQPLLYSLNLKDIEGGEAIQDNIYLEPFDIVYVPSTTITHVAKFVDSHINQIVPKFVSMGFSWVNWISPNP